MEKFLKSCFAFVLGTRHVVQKWACESPSWENLLPSASSARTKVPVVQEMSTTAQAFQSEHPAEDHQAAGDVHRPAKLHILHIR